MAKYLVTGACGFIGSALSMYLAQMGHTVIGFDNRAKIKPLKTNEHITLIDGDINDRDAIASVMVEAEGCFHLAALPSVHQSYLDWIGTHKANGTGTISVLDAAYRVRPEKPVPVVYMSSSSIYGSGNKPFAENSVPEPSTPYAADKASCEYYARVASKLYHVPCLGFRLFNAFGAGADPSSPYSGVIIQFLYCVLKNKPFEIYGDGLQVRDFVYVSDVIRALLFGMQHVDLQHKVYNICSGTPTPILEIATLLNKLTQKELGINFSSPRVMDTRYSQGNPDKARQELNFVAQTSLEEGLKLSLLELKENPPKL